MTAPSVTFTGGFVSVGGYTWLGVRTQQYTSIRWYGVDCPTCGAITLTFDEPADNISFLLMVNDNYRWLRIDDDQGHTFNGNLGCSFCAPPRYTNPVRVNWGYAGVRRLTIFTTAFPAQFWNFAIDDVSYTLPPKLGIVTRLDHEPDAPNPPDPVPVTPQTTINIPLGRTFSVRLKEQRANGTWVDVPSSFALGEGHVQDQPTYFEETLYPTDPMFLYETPHNAATRLLQSIHVGEAPLHIIPNDRQLPRVSVRIRSLSPAQFGETRPDNHTEWDGHLTSQGSVRGIPPQYIKAIATHESANRFDPFGWRYEPGADRRDVAPFRGRTREANYVLPSPIGNGDYPMGRWLCPRSINPGCGFSYLDDLHAATSLFFLRNGARERIPGDNLLNGSPAFITIREICDANPRQNWPVPLVCPPPPPAPPAAPGRQRPVSSRPNYDVTATPHLASSYGIMQTTWYSVMDDRVLHGVSPQTGDELRHNPSLLFDTDENLANGSASIIVGPNELRHKIKRFGMGGRQTLNPDWRTFSDYQAAIREGMRRYNGGGDAADRYIGIVFPLAEGFKGILPPDVPVVSNACAGAPTVTTQLNAPQITPGGTATLYVGSKDAVRYQWFEGAAGDESRPLPNSDSAYIEVTTDTPKQYWVRLTNECGSTTQATTIEVVTPCAGPEFLDLSEDRAVPRGTPVTLSATADGAQSYEWYTVHADGTATKVTNAASPSLEITPQSTAYYVVVVKNACDTRVSRPIEVRIAPCGDPVIITQPEGQDVNPSTRTARFSVVAQGTVLHYQWYEGQSGDTSRPVGTDSASFETPALTRSTGYWVRVSSEGSSCADDSATATARVCERAAISVDPLIHSRTVLANTAVEVSVAATGETLSYQWMQAFGDGPFADIPGANSPTHSAVITQKTRFKVVVRGNCFSGDEVTSGEAVFDLPVCPAPSFILDLLSAAIITEAGQAAEFELRLLDTAGVTARYHWYRNGRLIAETTSPKQTFAVQNADTIQVRVSGTKVCDDGNPATVDPVIDFGLVSRKTRVMQYGTCPLPPVAIDKQLLELPVPVGTEAVFYATADWPSVTWQWYRGESGDTRAPIASATGNRLAVSEPGVYWVRARAACGTERDSENVVVRTATCEPIRIAADPHDVDILAADPVTLSVDASALPNLAFDDYEWFEGEGTSRFVGRGRTLTVSPIVTTRYWVRIANACHTADSRMATVHVTSCGEIAVAQQPADVSIPENTMPSLSVAASSAHALHYQWYEGRSGDTSVPVGTDENVLRLAAPPAKTTSYWVRISTSQSGMCVVDSRTANVSVCRKPRLVRPLESSIVAPGQPAYLSVDAEGDGLSYRWFKGELGDRQYPAGTGPYLAVTNFSTEKYWVEITSDCAAPVDDAVLQAGPVVISFCPTVGAPAAAQAMVMPGTTTTLSVQADGSYLSYQWYRGARGDTSAPLPQSNSATIATPSITATTSFWVAVSSGNCTMTAGEVTVAVCNEPAILWNAAETEVRTAQSQVLSVSVTPVEGTTMTWYEGTSGDVAGSRVLSGPTINAGIAVAPATTANYWVRATRGNCRSDTPTLTVRVCIPTIVTQPAPVAVTAGSTARLTVAADAGPHSVQWYRGERGVTSDPVSNGTAATLDVVPAATAKYWARITGSCQRHADSESVTVTVCSALSLVSISRPSLQPGTGALLAVNTTGSGLTYQWYEGAAGVTTKPMGTASTLEVHPAATTDYWVRVADGCGKTLDVTTTVSVYPIITAQPADRRVTKGSTTSFSVTADGSRLRYEWLEGGDPARPVGTNAASFTTPALQASTSYAVRVISGDAATLSPVATATICTPPAQTVNSSGVSGANAVLSVDAPLPGTVYQWYRGTPGNMSNPVGTAASITVNPAATTTYWFRTTDAQCSADSAAVVVSICRPSITQQPANGNITAGQSHTLTVTATGDAPLSYQWYRGAPGTMTQPVSNGTGASVTVMPSATTTYWVRVTSPTGACSINSNAATVSVCQPPQITAQPWTNSVIDPGQTATVWVTATGTNVSYQWYRGQSGDTSQPLSTAAALSFQPAQTQAVWVKVSGCGAVSSNAVLVSVRPQITAQPRDVSITRGTTATFSVSASGSYLEYRWYQGLTGDTSRPVGGNSVSLVTPPLSADTPYWVRVVSGAGNTDSQTASALMCTVPSVSVHQPVSASGEAVTLTVTNPGATSYAWYRGPSGDTSQHILTSTTSPSITVHPTESAQYWVRATYPTCTSNSATVPVTVCQPRVTQQPQNASIVEGNSATLQVTVTGTPTLFYQWYQGAAGVTTTPIANANSASLVVSPATTTSYWVRITSAAGPTCFANSAAATVSVCVLPRVVQQPQNANVLQAGTTGALRVTASGSNLTYQWYAGAAGDVSRPVAGATTDLLSMTAWNTERYWVRVANGCGAVNSAAAWISVRPQVSGPASVSMQAGSTATFTVMATGTYLSYQWYRSDGQPVGTNSPRYVTPPLHAPQTFYCVVTSGTVSQHSAHATASLCDDAPPIFAQPYIDGTTNGCRTVSAGSNPLVATYQWYRGARGDTSVSAGTGDTITVCPAAFGTYWCRITNAESGCYVDSEAVSVQ